jgi:hypothetical protein
LHITQLALGKKITELEEEHRFHLFTRDKKRVVELTNAGPVPSKRLSQHSCTFGRAAHEGCDIVLIIRRSPYVDHAWISAMLPIRLPYISESPNPTDSVRNGIGLKVLVSELNLALVTGPPRIQITAVRFASLRASRELRFCDFGYVQFCVRRATDKLCTIFVA